MKPEWGTKHKCPGCGAHYYDMRKPEACCPKCATPANDRAALLAQISKIKPKAKPVIVDDIEDLDDIEVLDDDDLDDDDVPDTFIEDTDDLVGSDESDMSEVFENIDHDSRDMNA
jgi:hypothetical protein